MWENENGNRTKKTKTKENRETSEEREKGEKIKEERTILKKQEKRHER